MIRIGSSKEGMQRRFLGAAGGFAWWYVDMVDENGDGMVVIWSYGLPFLPGYAEAARRGEAPEPVERPSVNVAIYRGGELDCYLLQEYGPEDVAWTRSDEGRQQWAFGPNHFTSYLHDGERVLDGQLDCPVPGSSERLSGRFRVHGSVPRLEEDGGGGADAAAGSAHDWIPLMMPARGRAELSHGDVTYRLSGRAYHDGNGGDRPLHELGIHRWIWGRVPLEGRELIYYALWPRQPRQGCQPECFALSVDEQTGEVSVHEDLRFRGDEAQRSLGGLSWFRRMSLSKPGETGDWLRIHQRQVVDSGPFYMRFITRGSGPGGQEATGIGELIRPDRVDLGRHRPLVRMRVHDVSEGDNSMWLPLFTGPKRGRIGRLMRFAVEGLIN